MRPATPLEEVPVSAERWWRRWGAWVGLGIILAPWVVAAIAILIVAAA